MDNEIKSTQSDDPDADNYCPEWADDEYGWFETCRDWIGEGRLDGIEGNIGIKLSCFGHTKEQYDLLNEIMNELTAETRELIPKLIKRKAKEKKALLKK